MIIVIITILASCTDNSAKKVNILTDDLTASEKKPGTHQQNKKRPIHLEKGQVLWFSNTESIYYAGMSNYGISNNRGVFSLIYSKIHLIALGSHTNTLSGNFYYSISTTETISFHPNIKLEIVKIDDEYIEFYQAIK